MRGWTVGLLSRWGLGLGFAAAVLAGADSGSTARQAGASTEAAGWAPQEGQELLGTRAPQWRNLSWVQGGPLSLKRLRGKLVLLRFWLHSCPYCQRTAPALRELWSRYGKRGLVVVGLHTPSSEETLGPQSVAGFARELGFEFPVAMDSEGSTLAAYGQGTVFRRFSSMSFLLDRAGRIRFVHPGGEFHEGGGSGHEECNAAYAAVVRTIERLLQK
jgi:peroxiredoxin